MILTCPECATSYFVDDSRIPSAGRRVKCSSCGHRWMAGPDGPVTEEPGEALEPAGAEAEPAAEAALPEDDIVAAPAEPEPVVAPIRRAGTSVRDRRPEGRSSALIWAGVAAVAAALLAGVIVFREQIVRVWPKSSAAYAGLGLAVEGGGLVFEQVHVQPAFLAGRPVLSVTGAIHNVRDVPVTAPPVRVTLLDRAGQPVSAKIARPMDPAIPAGATRHFVITMLDPPATARDLEVRFESGKGKNEPHTAEAALTPAPVPAPPASAPAVAAPAAAPPVSAAPPAEPHLSPAAATEHG